MVKTPKPVAAIFGGSFDPPHIGHQQIVQAAAKLPGVDRVLIVPAYLNPFKTSSLSDAGQRLQWCHSLFDGIPKVSVESYEVDQGRSVTTWETVKHFKTNYDVRYLIIGSDNLSTLEKWHQFDALNREIIWIIATREGYDLKTDMLRSWQILEVNVPASSTEIRTSGDISHVDNKIKEDVNRTLQLNTKDNPS